MTCFPPQKSILFWTRSPLILWPGPALVSATRCRTRRLLNWHSTHGFVDWRSLFSEGPRSLTARPCSTNPGFELAGCLASGHCTAVKEHKPAHGWGPWSIKEGVHYAHAPAHALDEVVALRLHLDDSTAENGPLRVLPGTHKEGVLTDDLIHVLSGQLRPVDCLTPKGGVVAMRPLLVHASSKSRSDQPGRILHIEYTSAKAFDSLQLAVA
jgi:phytanoyl-CoA dioxygenase PhyH